MKGSIKAAALLQRELGDWWQDDRRHWCAYCGIPMRQQFGLGRPIPDTKATRDHLVPKAHGSGGLTIPACHGCNRSKGALSLAESVQPALRRSEAAKTPQQMAYP
ncbi:HNH endonuclease [Rhizobium bangladeshense]|uniref:HNH endonuclease n=1 Tax=Rhizobium bangladeshense TaxID=1138189 RepID=UPI001C8284A5|nr:hypothetical protein [Rhizobium bangladeshense]MBX4902981.1 hypothetical protein [Rhizobium bangladeshense]MBX4914558.1 hypothetical protein [Rhizobium bangladeshense]